MTQLPKKLTSTVIEHSFCRVLRFHRFGDDITLHTNTYYSYCSLSTLGHQKRKGPISNHQYLAIFHDSDIQALQHLEKIQDSHESRGKNLMAIWGFL